MTTVDGMFTGLVMGLAFSAPAFVAEALHHRKTVPLLVNVTTLWGAPVPGNEVLFASVALHLAMSVAYGGLYPVLLLLGIFPTITAVSILLYTIAFFLVVCCVVAPAMGLGFFGRREGRSVWIELGLTHALYALAYGYAATHFFVQ